LDGQFDVIQDKLSQSIDVIKVVQLEQIGGHMHPMSRSDCWQVIALGVAPVREEEIPSETVMKSVHSAMTKLLKTDPNAASPPPFLAENGFTECEVSIGKTDEQKAKCWYKNDVQGMKYFGACTVPGDAKDLAFKLWKPQNWRFLNCTDDAPNVVCCDLMAKARMEYLVLPSPHLLSGVMSSGIQFDDREALVLTWRDTLKLTIDGQEVEAHMIWSKSIDHPDYPDGGDSSAPVNGVNGDANGDPTATSLRTKGALATSLSRADVAAKERAGNGRQIIKVRGILLFQSGDKQVSAVSFGHEKPGGVYNNFSRALRLRRLGKAVSGGAPELVDELFTRLLDVAGQGAPSH